MKHLKETLEEIFGTLRCEEVGRILEAVNKDSKEGKVSTDKVAAILPMFNEIFNKKSRVMSKKVIGKYKEILKYYSVDDIRYAMEVAKKADHHIESGHMYCTLEYFSRMDQMDKWINVTTAKTSGFKMPSMNIKS